MENQNPTQPTQEVQNQTPTPVVESEPKGKFHFHKFAFLGIIFVILLGIIGGIYLFSRNNTSSNNQVPIISQQPTVTPTPVSASNAATLDPTANWKTYNHQGIFTLKYPENWKVGEADTKGAVPIGPSREESDCPHCAGSGVGIFVNTIDNPSLLPLTDFLKSQKVDLLNEFTKLDLPNISEGMINPKTYGISNVNEVAYINNGNTVVEIYCQSTVCTDKDLFKTILSTFRFE